MSGFSRKAPPHPRAIDLAVNGRVLQLSIREHGRATRITLRIEPGGSALRLTIPPGLPRREIDAFLYRHQGWLMTRLAKSTDPTRLEAGASVPIRNVAHRLVLTGKLRGLAEAAMEDGEPVLRVSGAPEHVARKVADHLKREARRDLEPAVARHAVAVGRKIAAIAYKDTRSRWGSCTTDGNLSFSWRLVMAPPLVIDYLAAHEVAHLREMNHGPRFWALCKSLCPETDEARKWLKQHGNRLQAFEF